MPSPMSVAGLEPSIIIFRVDRSTTVLSGQHNQCLEIYYFGVFLYVQVPTVGFESSVLGLRVD